MKTYHTVRLIDPSPGDITSYNALGYRFKQAFFFSDNVKMYEVVYMEKETETPDLPCICGHPKDKHLIETSGVCVVYNCPCGIYRERQWE